MKAIVVLSGGQDSATCLAMAVEKHGADEVAALTFAYGQRHEKEVEFASGIARHFGVRNHKTVAMDFYKSLTDNALFNSGMEIAKAPGAACPNTVVEGRNAFFLLAAGVWAKSLGAAEIWTGVSEADYSGYPDCRENFVKAQQQMMRLAMEWPFEIVTPFMHLSKADEWRIADELGAFDFIRENTLTCYNGVPAAGCGECPACRLRAAGLAEYLAGGRIKA